MKEWKHKDWSDFYEEFYKEMTKFLGEDLKKFYYDRTHEIYAGTSMKFNHLGQTEFQCILEALAKAQGKRYKRWYKKSYKKSFADKMRDAIEEGEDVGE